MALLEDNPSESAPETLHSQMMIILGRMSEQFLQQKGIFALRKYEEFSLLLKRECVPSE
jgi:hypothetical protein